VHSRSAPPGFRPDSTAKPTDFDGFEVEAGSGPQRFEVWEPRWWQLGRWLHWWKFRRYHGFVNMSIPAGMHGGPCKLRLRVVPSRQAAYGDAPKGYEP
jgi:hypothetical protein